MSNPIGDLQWEDTDWAWEDKKHLLRIFLHIANESHKNTLKSGKTEQILEIHLGRQLERHILKYECLFFY